MRNERRDRVAPCYARRWRFATTRNYPLGIDQYAGIEHRRGIEGGLRGPQRGGEGRRALTVIPGAVVAADRVVVRDGPPGFDHRLGGRRLDLVPLLDLASADRRREDRVVGRRPVRVDVGEPAGNP